MPKVKRSRVRFNRTEEIRRDISGFRFQVKSISSAVDFNFTLKPTQGCLHRSAQHAPTTVLLLNALQCIHGGETDEEPFARCFLPLSPRAFSPVEGGRKRPQRSGSFSSRTQVYVGFIGDPTKACLRGFSVTSPALCSVLCYSSIPRTATAFVQSSLSCRGYRPSVEKHTGKWFRNLEWNSSTCCQSSGESMSF